MKKFMLPVVLCLSLIIVRASYADLTSTLNFTGFFEYTGDGSINPEESICSAGFGGELCDARNVAVQTVDANLVNDGYYGVGALAYEMNLNLPEDRNAVYPWWLEVDFWLEGTFEDEGGVDLISFHLEDEMFDLGEFALGTNNSDEADFIASLPTSGNIGDLSFLFEGDDTKGLLLVALEENVFDYYRDERLELAFRGQLTLTAREQESSNVVPEPATIILLGSGMVGGAFVRKKKKA